MRFDVEDLVVEFPYERIYAEQYAYMLALKRSLDRKGHSLLELPMGGRSVALRHAAVALVGADWKATDCRQAGLRALHRSGCALRFRWLCEAVEAGDADAVARELYATNH